MYEFGTGFAPLVRDILFGIKKRRETLTGNSSPTRHAQFICARYTLSSDQRCAHSRFDRSYAPALRFDVVVSSTALDV